MRPISAYLPQVRLRPAAAAAAAAIVVTAGIVLALYQDAISRAQRIQETTVQAQILAASVSAALVFDDRRAAQEYVDALMVNPDIEAAAVIEPNGTIIASFSRGGPAPVTKHSVAARDRSGRILVAAPAMQGRMRTGTVYLRALEEPIVRRAARYGAILLLAIMAALIIAVLASAQSELSHANMELEKRARELGKTNRRLQKEIEERAKAEEALRQSQKMEAIGQLSGGIAHDFNNLLSIVLGNLQLMRRRIAQGRTDVLSHMDMATEGIMRAATLTQRLLAFARRQPLAPKPVDLGEIVRDTMTLIRHSVGEHVEVVTKLDAKGWTLCDANQMENLIINMAINARDAMPEGGTLAIATRDVRVGPDWHVPGEIAPGDYVELRITDTGTGMSEDVLARAIDPFFTTKPIGKGTGLGLSMAFGYVRQSNGHLRIESKIGEGTSIIVLMPRIEEFQTKGCPKEAGTAGVTT